MDYSCKMHNYEHNTDKKFHVSLKTSPILCIFFKLKTQLSRILLSINKGVVKSCGAWSAPANNNPERVYIYFILFSFPCTGIHRLQGLFLPRIPLPDGSKKFFSIFFTLIFTYAIDLQKFCCCFWLSCRHVP